VFEAPAALDSVDTAHCRGPLIRAFDPPLSKTLESELAALFIATGTADNSLAIPR
jgi:threonine aldolase